MIKRIVIENEVYQKIMHWVNKSHYEVSGLGKIQVRGDDIVVIAACLLPQKNGFSHTDIEAEDIGKLEYDLRNTPGDLRFWWHSHVNMPVFWSQTDESTQEDLAAGGWFVSTVFNKKREMRSAICMKRPVPLFLDEIKTEVVQYLAPDTIKSWDEEYEQNVTNITVTYLGGKNENYANARPLPDESKKKEDVGESATGSSGVTGSSAYDDPDEHIIRDLGDGYYVNADDVFDTMETKDLDWDAAVEYLVEQLEALKARESETDTGQPDELKGRA
jgi:hypothetical protein